MGKSTFLTSPNVINRCLIISAVTSSGSPPKYTVLANSSPVY